MRSRREQYSACLLAALLVALSSRASAQVLPGYETDTVSVAPGGAFLGGLDLLPNGNYVLYDGTAIVELSASDGSFVQTLFAPAGQPFGSFVKVDPTQARLYFGESSFGDIYELDLTTLTAKVVGNVGLPFDLAFDPKGRLFLSATAGFGIPGKVHLLDPVTGALDEILDTTDASGPLEFASSGDLYYVTPDTSVWPPDPETSELRRFTAAQVESAVGPGNLTESDGQLVALLDGAFSMRRDESGDLFVTDSAYYKLTEVDAETGIERAIWDEAGLLGLTFLTYRAASHGAFEWYQPAGSGELIAIATDFFSFNDARRVRPARPHQSTTPDSPIPPGPFDFDLKGGVPDGFAWIWVSAGLAAEEEALRNPTWPAPLFLGLDLGGFFVPLASSTDKSGALTWSATNPGLGGATLGVQTFVGESAAGPFYGTSQPLLITLQ